MTISVVVHGLVHERVNERLSELGCLDVRVVEDLGERLIDLTILINLVVRTDFLSGYVSKSLVDHEQDRVAHRVRCHVGDVQALEERNLRELCERIT